MVDYISAIKIVTADSWVNTPLTAFLEMAFPPYDPNKPIYMIIAEVFAQSVIFALVNLEIRQLFPGFYGSDPTGGLFISFFINTMTNFNQKVLHIRDVVKSQLFQQLGFVNPLTASPLPDDAIPQ
jgi:hypothetical protein